MSFKKSDLFIIYMGAYVLSLAEGCLWCWLPVQFGLFWSICLRTSWLI